METDTNTQQVEVEHLEVLPTLEPCDHAERLETAHQAVMAILGNTNTSDSGLMSIIRSEMSRRNN